jgi:hypothetical protein
LTIRPRNPQIGLVSYSKQPSQNRKRSRPDELDGESRVNMDVEVSMERIKSVVRAAAIVLVLAVSLALLPVIGLPYRPLPATAARVAGGLYQRPRAWLPFVIKEGRRTWVPFITKGRARP